MRSALPGPTGAELYEGFIVDGITWRHQGRYREGHHDREELWYFGRLRDGTSFGARVADGRPGFWVRAHELSRIERVLQQANLEAQRATERDLQTMDGEAACRLEWPDSFACRAAAQLLDKERLRSYESDLSWPFAYLLDHSIGCSVQIAGRWRRGQAVERLFPQATLTAGNWSPTLRTLSFDIETAGAANHIIAIAIMCRDPNASHSEVLLIDAATRGNIHSGTRNAANWDALKEETWIRRCADESELLRLFVERIRRLDADILTGWNIIDFDLQIIAQRARACGIRLQLGRSNSEIRLLPGGTGRNAYRSRCIIEGRQIIDSMRLVRYGPQRHESYSLAAVARTTLGEGKYLSFASDKPAEIERLWRMEPLELCRYCRADADLVLSILDRTGLMELTWQRSLLTGVPLQRAWSSIAAFDAMYIAGLRKRGMVAPTAGVDQPQISGAAGGGIIHPRSGLYRNVMVFDFRSLYPSIIVTFNIDPLTLLDHGGPNDIVSPISVAFSRSEAILPVLLKRFFAARHTAQQAQDRVASFVYKIIMNSCYGIFGAPTCRFADARLSGAITSFGRHILNWCNDNFIELGYRVLYGDTDSLFVLADLPADAPPARLFTLGESLCNEINRRLTGYLRQEYDLASQLELEFEKAYSGFLLPPLRIADRAQIDDNPDEEQRGRAKGYAGRLATADPDSADSMPIEIIGMEAARRDWTDMAHAFQYQLLKLLFDDATIEEIHTAIQTARRDLFAGVYDDRLIYRKRLRKPLSAYSSSKPPHVKAASLLPARQRYGTIRYVITRAGPEPAAQTSASPRLRLLHQAPAKADRRVAWSRCLTRSGVGTRGSPTAPAFLSPNPYAEKDVRQRGAEPGPS